MIKTLPLSLLVLGLAFGLVSSLSCFQRFGVSSSNNGTTIACSLGGFCYTFPDYSASSSNTAGCSQNVADLRASANSVVCTTDNCNTLTPSAISCYSRVGYSISAGEGTVTACPTGFTTCYTLFSSQLYAGCGKCSSHFETAYYGCRECSSSLCNTQTPSAITCFSRTSGASSPSNGSEIPCPTGATSCYSFNTGEAGCGTCTGSTSPLGCVSCSSSYCNAMRTCYSAGGLNSTMYNSSRTAVTCTDSTSCYQYTSTSGSVTSYYSGCGGCTGVAGCSACTADLCNSFDTASTTSAAVTSAATGTAATGSAVTVSSATSVFGASSTVGRNCGARDAGIGVMMTGVTGMYLVALSLTALP